MSYSHSRAPSSLKVEYEFYDVESDLFVLDGINSQDLAHQVRVIIFHSTFGASSSHKCFLLGFCCRRISSSRAVSCSLLRVP